jgi:hypothetical protein
MSGEQIAHKVHDTNKSAQGIVLKGKMTLAGVGGGSSEARSMVLLAYYNSGLSNGLFRFTDSSYRGQQCLQSKGKVRRIFSISFSPLSEVPGRLKVQTVKRILWIQISAMKIWEVQEFQINLQQASGQKGREQRLLYD